MTSQKLASRNRALKVAILDAELTQRRVARRTRIDETRLSRIISGAIAPEPREREKIAACLKRPEADLFPSAVSA